MLNGVKSIPSASVISYFESSQPPKTLLFGVFSIGCALFTATSFAWAIDGAQKTSTKLWATSIVCASLALWTLLGVTAEELFLVCLPLCASFGMFLGSLLGKESQICALPNEIEAHHWIFEV